MSKKHSSEDQVNGLSSPAKMPKLDERMARMKDLLSKGGGPGGKLGGPGGKLGGQGPLILPKPKPKPKPKPTAAAASDTTDSRGERSSSMSPPLSPSSVDHHMEDVGPIILNTDSLKQFSEAFEYDFDAVVRHQILDSTAQKDRAALSQSKGLQNRRLPSNVAGKVPEDYSEQRKRANTYAVGNTKKAVGSPLRKPLETMEEVDGENRGSPEITEEERKQRNLSKLGVQQQSNNPLAALGNILKRNTGGRGSWRSPKSSKTPGSPPKSKKKNSLDAPSASPVFARLGSEPPQSAPKSPKGFLRNLRRSNSKKKKGVDGDDIQSETSSVVSLPVTNEQMDTSPPGSHVSPPVADVSVSVTKASDTSVVSNNTSIVSMNGGFSPAHTSSPARTSSPAHTSSPARTSPARVSRVPLRNKPAGSPSTHRKTTDSAIFREGAGSFEPLFGTESNLFDSSELDALMGKKKERSKTPEGIMERPNEEEAEKKIVTPKKSKSFNSRAPLPIIVPKVEKKRSFDSPRLGIKANLHRYESNSMVSKTTDLSPSDESPPSADTADDATTEKPTAEAKQKSSLLFEECEDDLFGPVKSSDESKKPADAEKDLSVKKASLFEDDDDDLFPSKPAVSTPKKAEDQASKSPAQKAAEKPEPRKSLEDVLEESVKETPKQEKIEDIFKEEVEEESRPSAKEHGLFEKDEAETKKKGDNNLFGDALFDDISAKTESPSKHSTLFDEDEDSTGLFSARRPRKNLADDSNTDPLFADIDDEPKSHSSSATSSPKARPKVAKATDVSVTDQPLGASDDDELDLVVTKPKPERTDAAADAKSTPPPEEKEDVTEEAPVAMAEDSKPEPAPPPTAKKPGKGDTAAAGRKTDLGTKKPKPEPSWMEELKKRKQARGGDATSPTPPKKDTAEAPMPEWKKRALERKKKAEDTKLGSSSPKPDRAKKTDTEVKSRYKTRAEREREAKEKEGKESSPRFKTRREREKEAKEKEEKEKNEKADTPEVKSRYKTRAEREREAKEKEEKEKEAKEKEEKEKEAKEKENEKEAKENEEKENEEEKIEKVDTVDTEVKSRYKTRAEREREAKEKEGKEVEKKDSPPRYKTRAEREKEAKEKEESSPRFKTRREREREAKEKEEKEKGVSGSPEVKPRYKTRAEREREAKEKEGSPSPRFKTRREREREAKEKEEKEKAEKGNTEVKYRYKTRAEREREAKEKEEAEKGSPTRYKTRREREREAKEKEEKEKQAKEDNKPKSPAKPALTKKPSIEVVSKRMNPSPTKSLDEVDGKSPESKEEQTKVTDAEDDVFAVEDSSATTTGPSSGLSPPLSPTVPISVTSVVDSSKADVVANGHKDTDKPNGDGRPTRHDSTSDKSSVSSETETKPYRSHSQIVSVSSRSPTPTSMMRTSDSVPEWKKQLMERKKSSSSPVHKAAPKKVEPQEPDSSSNLPQWKRELLAKKKAKGDDKEVGPRPGRSVTVTGNTTPSSRRSKEPAPTPDFMKEFQKKKQRNVS